MTMLRRADIDDIAAMLFRARYQLSFGERVLRAERDARTALERLGRLGALSRPRPAEKELLAEASLSIGRALRLQGRQQQATLWLTRAAGLFAEVVSEGRAGATPLAETLNLLTVLDLNMRPEGHAALQRPLVSLAAQSALLTSSLPIRDRVEHEIDLVQRVGELLLLSGDAVAAHALLARQAFRSVADERPEHSRALRVLFAARVAVTSGRLDESADALEDVADLAVVDDSPFVRVMFLEAKARTHDANGDPGGAHVLLERARRLRLRERINEQPERAGGGG